MIGIISARQEEAAELKSLMTGSVNTEIAGMTFTEGYLNGRKTVIAVSGIGKVNSAACTQILIDHYRVECVINSGIGGALKNEVNIGDIVLSSDAVQHDVNVRVFGCAQGQIPGMKTLAFPADRHLLEVAEASCRATNPDIGVYIGRVASGDQFIADTNIRAALADTFDALCCEMGGAAIAQVAYLNRVPFIIIRAMSDKADGTAAAQYDVFEKDAIRHFVGMTVEMVRRL